jgi:hypothetical protein
MAVTVLVHLGEEVDDPRQVHREGFLDTLLHHDGRGLVRVVERQWLFKRLLGELHPGWRR